MNWRQTTLLLYSPLFQTKIVKHGYKHLSQFAFVKVVVMLCMSLAAGAFLLAPMSVEAAGRHLAAVPMVNCTLIVPLHPLSAVGLATPYQLVGTNPDMPCHEVNPAQSAFVQGAVLNLATGQISVYDPLVIDQGTKPAITPIVPRLPRNALIALWFGFNGNVLTLQRNDGFREGMCVDGLLQYPLTDRRNEENLTPLPKPPDIGDSNGTMPNMSSGFALGNTSPFGQFAYCNAPAFFKAANNAIVQRKLIPPPLGKAADGLTCPSTRDFSVVDQDQSDNVTTSYLALKNGQTAQDTLVNHAELRAKGQKFTVLTNPSDNKLLVSFIDSALDCDPWKAPNLANPGRFTTALPLNELQAAAHQRGPVALVPAGDPMVLVNGQPNREKLNLYRIGVDQPSVTSLDQASTVTYCRHLLDIAPPRLLRDERLFKKAPSPVPAMANNLFTFMAQRFNTTWGADGLNCVQLLHEPSPIRVTVVNGVAVDATIEIDNHLGGK